MSFQVTSDYSPKGDQPQAIQKLAQGVVDGEKYQTLLGVTGSGKTFTVANVIQEVQRPTLVLAHNKTLAAQLYSEFKQFFPNNAVEYFVSYYDYYQPEAFMPVTGVFIEKDLSINEELEKMRLSTTSSLLSGRRDVLVVASVSCLYGIGNPVEFKKNVIEITRDQVISRTKLLHSLVQSLYARTEADFNPGTFRIKGDTVEIYPSYADDAYRVHFFGDEIEEIESFDAKTSQVIEKFKRLTIYPANMFVTSPEVLQGAIWEIQQDLVKQVDYFKEIGKHLEAKRLEERTNFDLEMIRELGYCSGIENYSRYLDGRQAGTRPFCLLDYFPSDYLMVVDESHVTVSQVHAMYGGDRSRKENLVEYGFRLPAAMDNRPLKFEEFEALQNQVIYVSATPADYELQKSDGIYVEQIIRPTGLLDPVIEVRPSLNQIDDLIEEIQVRCELDERVLVTTLTKRMAEELAKYLTKVSIRCRYIHSEVDTLERIEIMQDLRKGIFDVLIGVNLLREGLDLPEVSLVAILDADKEGFLRNHRSLTQTIGRAARNLNGKAIMYADKITASMQRTIDETNYRRTKQINFNVENNITPQALNKKIDSAFTKNPLVEYELGHTLPAAAEPETAYLSKADLEKLIREKRKSMEKAAKELDFMQAAKLRDDIKKLQEQLP
ncbi:MULTISPECIES: excinuclease ABC subunit UvrB [Flavobacterium]|jgi:excinuclease ABC subunit B|uniref:UvrABC system protein B n=1 Tax=Flavobacterium johnsoniae (strain ATCC 17061 / DSM 2064 / JCM 8514 / BCRC 14874 / CCUG 350202 / NBRC 14942 / NCIMB 11054 / UW101) TaxID=376686 RepID=A5FHX1_FLAJ1|nr:MULTISPECIES: excinuclease ABC subunit UvrB [Flavobacterium]ABQ05198.1 excinuclease ABC, B subunit [Flavobacterium johnsoniae UW101]OXE96911.1 excinuclease ABC subunit B [Flavobacterium johnsoniae UW101]WDF60903.1 excinuclease ABC subunit UvrB [Flavobacterium sp. KACC 22758]WQG82999.1 excinuclease ABC subunit UvrB [Flavobacterium johnsoniae UW101]SHL64113.1 Excinuclease ABC subunit B [Flavobacterium johnsoniae]